MKCAFDFGYKCVALTHKNCVGCHFRKTKKEVEESRKKVERRIDSLPEEQQQYIREKYYGKENYESKNDLG